MMGELRRLSRSLLFLYGGTIVTRMGAFVFPYLTIYLSESRGLGLDYVGLILSTGSVGLLCGNFAGGWLADRSSRKWTLILALLVNALGFAGLAFDFEWSGHYALCLVIGYFGSGMYNPAANTLIADLTDESTRPFAYTVNYVCVNIGMALGPLLGGFLAAAAYRWIFVGDVLTSLVCAALICVGV
jgi:MFS family permease